MIERRETSSFNWAEIVIVNNLSVCTPAVAESMQFPVLILTIVVALDVLQNASIVSVDATLNPVFE